MVTLTYADLQHFAVIFVLLSMCGGVFGALAFGLFVSVLTRVIAGMSGWMDRCTRIYTARMRALARHRLNRNG
ncbi:hypothetical protein [Delftia acidovorans]|uniref:hypothetical protein n=1 Tax=Delftia acidovorans TaxID=80866 RepID=UPI00333ED6C1